MAIPRYLAMTAAEFWSAEALPEHVAWMACHSSSYGTGLSNLPEKLPPSSMIILNDRIPMQGHDPQQILAQMAQLVEAFCPSGVLLDFQRPEDAGTAAVAKLLAEHLPCPVGVTEGYAKELSCPVFYEPPLVIPITQALAPWAKREIWLDIAPAGGIITVTADASKFQTGYPEFGENPVFTDEALCCRYQTQMEADSIQFYLRRDLEEIACLLDAGEKLGVTRAIGLYQQLGKCVAN